MKSGVEMRTRGFTLLELMATIAVLAILTSIAVPSFRDFTANQRLRAASFDLRTDLMLARSEALKRNSAVTIQRRQAAGWQTGWIVFVVATNETLRSRNDIGSDVSVASAANSIVFSGNGRVTSPAGAVQFGIATSTGAASRHRCLTLDPAGMPRTHTESCS